MDWNPFHGSLFTGAGTPWGTTDTRPAWAASLPDINLDPRFSDVFKNTIAPTLEVVSMASYAALALPLGQIAGAKFQQANESLGIADPLGMNLDQRYSDVFKNAYVPAVKAVGTGLTAFFAPYLLPVTMLGEDYAQKQLGIQKGEGTFAEYSQYVGMLAGGLAKIASDPGTSTEDKLKAAAPSVTSAAAVVAAANAPKPTSSTVPRGAASSQGYTVAAPVSQRTKTFLALGLAYVAYKI